MCVRRVSVGYCRAVTGPFTVWPFTQADDPLQRLVARREETGPSVIA
jgi:hypothetical protein